MKVTVPNKKKDKKKGVKNPKGKREKLSLYPLEFDDALRHILTVKSDRANNNRQEKQSKKK